MVTSRHRGPGKGGDPDCKEIWEGAWLLPRRSRVQESRAGQVGRQRLGLQRPSCVVCSVGTRQRSRSWDLAPSTAEALAGPQPTQRETQTFH